MSEPHLALYRKYRSQTFGDLVGQGHVVRTLQNGIASGRISHSYLFTGPRGTGKTSTARLLAKALNCVDGPSGEPCNACENCLSITKGNCIDVTEVDAASEAGVDEVRENIVQVVEYKPAVCRYKVFIIDEVHDLSPKAFDALLKTIEEPPSHVVFILATTEYAKVPPTIRSRCQKYEFHRASLSDLGALLEYVAQAEGIEADRNALLAIARLADGGYRDALTLLEQAVVTSEGRVTLDHVYSQLGLVSEDEVDSLLVAIREGEIAKVIEGLEAVYRLGSDPKAILDSMLYRLSDLTRAQYGIETGVDAGTEAALHALAARLGAERLLDYRQRIADLLADVREVSLPRLWLEAQLVGLASGRNAMVASAQSVPLPVAAPPTSRPQPKQTSAPVPAKPRTPPVAAQPPDVAKQSTPERPEASAIEPSGDPVLDAARSVWSKVVANISEVSTTAKLHLAKTTVGQASAGRASIVFDRLSDAEWVQDRPKLLGAIKEQWLLHNGAEPIELTFSARTKAATQSAPMEPAVELPSEGEKLNQLGREMFQDV